MSKKKTYPLCDFKCPKHESCAWYLEKINKRETVHWAVTPWSEKTGNCAWYVPLSEDELLKKVNEYLNPFNN